MSARIFAARLMLMIITILPLLRLPVYFACAPLRQLDADTLDSFRCRFYFHSRLMLITVHATLSAFFYAAIIDISDIDGHALPLY